MAKNKELHALLRAYKRRQARKPTPLEKLKAQDWIALRLLYLILASDPSAAMLRDVNKTRDYYKHKLGSDPDGLLAAFNLLNKEIANDQQTFANPEVKLTRAISVGWKFDADAGDDTVELHKGLWKKYVPNT